MAFRVKQFRVLKSSDDLFGGVSKDRRGLSAEAILRPNNILRGGGVANKRSDLKVGCRAHEAAFRGKLRTHQEALIRRLTPRVGWLIPVKVSHVQDRPSAATQHTLPRPPPLTPHSCPTPSSLELCFPPLPLLRRPVHLLRQLGRPIFFRHPDAF